MSLQRKLGFATIFAIVTGNMVGSGLFFTPGELASVAVAHWQVYFFWGLCGLITLCGALTLAELSILLPRPGVMYHSATEAYGPFAGFFQGWVQILISGPGSIAGIAILFGELANQMLGIQSDSLRIVWAISAILFFVAVNLRGAEWGGGTQVIITAAKIGGIMALVVGAIFFAAPAPLEVVTSVGEADDGLFATIRVIGLGVAVVLFTYDGWADASHLAGEVKNPQKNLPLAMGFGVVFITLMYLLVNYAFLRVVSLDFMRENPTLVAMSVAKAAFGETGSIIISVLMWVSIFGALGGLIMSIPRLYYATVSGFKEAASKTFLGPFFNALSYLSPKRSVPTGALLYSAAIAIIAILFFGTFSRIVGFLVVPLQCINIMVVSSIFILRPRLSKPESFRTPGYPFVPAIFIIIMSMFMVSAVIYNPLDSLVGIVLSLSAIPVYLRLKKAKNEQV